MKTILFRLLFLVPIAGTMLPAVAFADDSAASIAAGGLVPRRETRIVMAKEVLSINDKKIVVDYDFRNDTDEDVTTEVAFPVPPYKNGFPDGPLLPEQRFDSFKLYIDGKPARYQIEAKATFKGRDFTAILAANHIDIATFGHFDDNSEKTPDLDRLNPVELKKLLNLGVAKIDDNLPSATWTAHLQYH